MVRKLHLNENAQNHFLLLEPDWNKQVYIVRDEADSIQEIKTLAQEWCDSDRFHIPTEYRKGHDIIYYGYCPETKKVYLPRWYTKADAEPFNYDWEIYGIEDYIIEDVQSDNLAASALASAQDNDSDSLFDNCKQKILNLLNNGTAKSVKIISRTKDISWEDINDVVEQLMADNDILDAIVAAGVTAKLQFASNRYAQYLPDVTFKITNSNPRHPGWSKWA